MPDLWIDDHVGDEARPRPEFKDALRSSLAADLGRRRTPWRALGWAAAAVVLIGVVATVVVNNRDDANTISPGPSGQSLIDQVVGRTWYLATDNGFPVASRPEYPASFELRADGSYVGSDGCNDYGSTVDSQPKSGWSIAGATLQITGTADMTAVGCSFRTSMPLTGDSELSLSADGTALTITGDRIYVATTLPPLAGPELAARLVGVRWTVTSVATELTSQEAWFEFHADGTLEGFNGCVEYAGTGWSLDGNEITVPPVTMDQPLCTDKPDIIPFTGNTSRIAIDGLGLGLSITNEVVYTAVPPDTPDPSATTTTAPFVNGDDLAAAIADKDWYVITADGVMVQSSISIRFHADGTVTGNNGCMDYANDPAAADGWSLNGRLISVPALIEPGDCVGVDTMIPALNGSALSLDATGTRLTATGPRTYILSSEPGRDRVANVRWYVFVHDNEQVAVNAWFELHDDGSFSGFDGCNDYASSVDPSAPASGWKIENGELRVFGTVEQTEIGCDITPLMPVVDGTTLGFQESFNAIYMEGPAGQFTVTLSPTVDATTTTFFVPVGPVLTPEDRASLLVAALLDRANVHNSFGGNPLPIKDMIVVETVGEAAADGAIDLTKGTLLTPEERAAITAAFAPNTVEFVSASAIPYPSNDGDRSVLQVGAPLLVEGQLAVVSSLSCGSLCAIGGAVAATKNADGTWTMGDPVGPQFIA